MTEQARQSFGDFCRFGVDEGHQQNAAVAAQQVDVAFDPVGGDQPGSLFGGLFDRLEQRRDDLVIKRLDGGQIDGAGARPAFGGRAGQDVTHVPDALPGVNGEARFTQGGEGFAGLVQFGQDVESAPVAGFGGQVFDQRWEIRVGQLRGGRQVGQFGEGIAVGVDDAAEQGDSLALRDAGVDVPGRVEVRQEAPRAERIAARHQARGIQ